MKLFGSGKKRGGDTDGIRTPAGWRKPVIAVVSVLLAVLTTGFAAWKIYVRPPQLPPDSIGATLPGGGEKPVTTTHDEIMPPTGDVVKEWLGQNPELIMEGRKEGWYTAVIGGMDNDDYATDTLMVAAFDTVNKKINIVNIPRDTMVNVKRANKKINVAYAVGNSGGKNNGAQELRDELKTILGFAPDFYAIVGLDAFVDLVDEIGGVEFDVPNVTKRGKNGPVDGIYYHDPDQNLYIDLKGGVQPIDGAKAMQLVRFREYPTADIGRIKMQQKFMKTVADKLLRYENIAKIPSFISILNANLRSDLDYGEMIWFANSAKKINTETDITFSVLPGDYAGWYGGRAYVFLDNADAIVKLVNDKLNPYNMPITKNDLNLLVLRDNSSASNTASVITTESAEPQPSDESRAADDKVKTEPERGEPAVTEPVTKPS